MRREENETRPTSESHHQSFAYVDFSLRLLAIPLSVASIWVMVKNKQVSDDYGKVEFSNLSGLKYLVCSNAISAGYAFASLVFSPFKCSLSGCLLYLFDQVVAYLMVTSMAAVAELLYLANKGDTEVSWSSACSYFGKFCYKIHVSLGLHVIAMVCFLSLSLLSAYRLFSKYEAPSVAAKEVGGSQAD